MGSQIRREDHIRIEHRGFRIGYYHYDRSWRDDRFCYPYYSFTPFVTTCVVSPWYYYPQLPPYIAAYRVSYAQPPPLMYNGWDYQWRRDRYDREERTELDYAIDDIVEAFEQGDRRAINRLVPRSGTVTLSVDGSIVYAVQADDFYDMYLDAVESARTVSYKIVEVKANQEDAQIVALHEYRDPWGQVASVYHRYRLGFERGRAVIRYFSTSGSLHW